MERGSLGEQVSSDLGHRLTLRVDTLDVVVVDAELHLRGDFVGVSQLEQEGCMISPRDLENKSRGLLQSQCTIRRGHCTKRCACKYRSRKGLKERS